MSMPSADDELIQEYLVESREHLATIENDLLRIEQDGAAIDEQLVNRVFRAAHSIKGGAGFFSLTRIRELAHRTESVLDLVRSGRMVPTPEIVSVLLLAFDQLRGMLGAWQQSNSMEIDEYLSALAGLTADSSSSVAAQSLQQVVQLEVPGAGRLIEIAAFDLDQSRRGGRTIYLIEYDLIRDLQRRNKSPLEVMKQLSKCGTIIDSRCDFDMIGTLDDEPFSRIPFAVLYSSALEPELINDLLEIPPEHVHVIDKKGGLRSLLDLSSREESAMVVEAPAAASALPSLSVAETSAKAPVAEATIRLNVELLDSLMNLAGEMVLSRNQLSEAVAQGDLTEIRASAHRLSLVTSELQAAVALTRMQPVRSLFAKFPRVVRDLARDLGKEAQLDIEGGDVEIDKSILEGLSDPLTHMIRNAVDHGLESPKERLKCGKAAMGRVVLRASHQGGQVVIEISDDGKGLSGEKVGASMLKKGMITADQLQSMSEREKMMLIFLPGVSTAEKLSDVSGRGVGMDVVKTNLDRLGGKIEIDSVLGQGTVFRIKLPLTLAIIPSLLVSEGGQRFAIPQVSVLELIRIPKQQVAQRIDCAGELPVLLLRDRLVPLVYLRDVLGVGTAQTVHPEAAVHVVLVESGSKQYGLVVEALHDTVEIVVKPLGRHLQGIGDYAGATILGDGRVALILDVAGVALRVGLREGVTSREGAVAQTGFDNLHSMLFFENAPGEHCALPIELVSRVERVELSSIQRLAGRLSWQCGETILPIVTLSEVAQLQPMTAEQQSVVIVFEQKGQSIGLLASEPLDMEEVSLVADTKTLRQPCIAGSAVLRGRSTLLIDLGEIAATLQPNAVVSSNVYVDVAPTKLPAESAVTPQPVTVLIAEDSDFFRGQICRLVEAVGFRPLAAPDGQAAWELLEQHGSEITLVATDVEMPHLDGLQLTRRIRSDARFGHLPVIALSSLAGESEIANGLAAGVSEYQVKLDPDLFMASLSRIATNPSGA
jgi:two-component system, chemotaxis family, sensor kinase CheA